MDKLVPTVAVIDSYVNEPSLFCYNQLVTQFPNLHFTYHTPVLMGTSTLSLNESTIAYIILGSASHVTQKLEWQHTLGQFLLGELNRKIPILGICFGHQLMAHMLGAQVDFEFADQTKFLGSRLITFTQDFMGFKKDQIIRVAVSHRQTVKALPDCLQEVACSEVVRNDVIKHKTLPFVGIQPHPEASLNFCTEDAHIVDPKELEQTRTGGFSFVANFIKHYIKNEPAGPA